MYDSLDAKKQERLKYYFNKSTGIIVLGNSLTSMFDGILHKDKVFVCENGVQDEYMMSEEEITEKLIKNENLSNKE